jgi:hypothetical protein
MAGMFTDNLSAARCWPTQQDGLKMVDENAHATSSGATATDWLDGAQCSTLHVFTATQIDRGESLQPDGWWLHDILLVDILGVGRGLVGMV